MTTTQISITSDPRTFEIPTLLSQGQPSPKHALLINLSTFENFPFGEEPPNQLSESEKETVYRLFVNRLKQIVKDDGREHPPIDMVRFIPTSTREGPSDRT